MTALISIGVSDYGVAASQDPAFGTLDFAASDATRIHDVMTAHLRMTSAQLLTSGAGGDSEANRINLLRAIEALDDDDTASAIVYFSGHGFDVRGALHLCPEDFDPRVPEHSSVAVSLIVNRLARRRGWSLIVIDACRNRVRSQRRRRPRATERGGVVFVADNVCVLLACSNDQQALETPTIDGAPAGGLFTHFLCQGMEGAPRSSRRLSVGAWFDGARAGTADFALDALERQQVPRAVGMSPHDVALRYSASRRVAVPIVPHPLAPLGSGAEASSPAVQEGGYGAAPDTVSRRRP